jgi:GNAT superfamily N-acetyltransferase
MAQPLIRRAVVADAEAGAYCHATCWQEAYDGIVDPVKLAEATGDIPDRTERWRTSIEDGAERWVAIHPAGDDAPVTDRVVGFSAPGISRDHDVRTALELYAIYVRKAWWGTGLADRLLDVAIGNQSAIAWVFEANARARAFYTRHGFLPDGARKDEPFFGEPEIRMVR